MLPHHLQRDLIHRLFHRDQLFHRDLVYLPDGRTVRAGAFPISIDAAGFEALATSDEAVARAEEIRASVRAYTREHTTEELLERSELLRVPAAPIGHGALLPTIGYGIKTNSTGTVLLDLDKAYQGKTEAYLDLHAAYRGKLKAFGNFNYRVQINVRNALNENDPIPVGALTTGAISRLATVDSRVTQLTFAVDF